MARKFNESEKQQIREALIHEGKSLFKALGFQKTSIRDITERVGIAQGTFYNFFNSKQELYFIILEQKEKKLRKQLMQTKASKKSIKETLHNLLKAVETNPLIRELYVENNMKHMVEKLPTPSLNKHFENDNAVIFALIKKWEKEGISFNISSQEIAGVLRALFILTFHQREIGSKVYEETLEFFIDVTVDRIIERGN